MPAGPRPRWWPGPRSPPPRRGPDRAHRADAPGSPGAGAGLVVEASSAQRVGQRLDGLDRERVTGRQAAEAGLIDLVAPTLGDLIVGLHGKEVPTAAGPVRLSTAKQIDTKDGPRQTADQPVRFIKLGTLGLRPALADQPVGRLPAPDRRARPDGVRVLHHRHRAGRAGGRGGGGRGASSASPTCPSPGGRWRCSSSPRSASPSTCRPVTRASGRGSASSGSWPAPSGSTGARRPSTSRCGWWR